MFDQVSCSHVSVGVLWAQTAACGMGWDGDVCVCAGLGLLLWQGGVKSLCADEKGRQNPGVFQLSSASSEGNNVLGFSYLRFLQLSTFFCIVLS